MNGDIVHIPLGLKSQVYRGAMPFSKFNANKNIMGDLQARKVTHVLVLCSQEECNKFSPGLLEVYRQNHFRVTHQPIPNYGVPSEEELQNLVGPLYKDLANSEENNTYIHCMGGKGRTGLIIACLARLALGMDAQKAIDFTRNYITGAIENETQENAIKAFKI